MEPNSLIEQTGVKPCFSLCVCAIKINLIKKMHLNVRGQLLNNLGCDLVSLVSLIQIVTTSSFLKPQSTSGKGILRTFDKSIYVIKILFNRY